MSCINFTSPEFKKLAKLSGLPTGIISARIQRFQKNYQTDKFPSLELLMTAEEGYDIVYNILNPTLFGDTYKISQSKIKDLLNQYGIVGDDKTSVDLFTELNNTYKNTKIERIKGFTLNNTGYVEFKISKIPTKYDLINNIKSISKSDILQNIYSIDSVNISSPEPVYKIGEWNVYETVQKYIINKGKYNPKSKYKFNSLEQASLEADNLFKTDNNLSIPMYNTILNNNKLIYDKLKEKGEYKFKIDSNELKLSEFSLYNIDYPSFRTSSVLKIPYSMTSNENIIKSNLNRDSFFKYIEGETELYKHIYKGLEEKGYNIDKIKSIIDNNYKIMDYLLLKIKYYSDNKDDHDKFKKTPHAETKAQYDINASLYALNILENQGIDVTTEIQSNSNGNYVTLKVKKESSKLLDNINTKRPKNNESILNLLTNIKNNYGINYNLVTTDELNGPEWSNLIDIAITKKAFIYDGEIYINIDKAKLSDPLHELSHLFLGSLRQRNKELYKSYIDKIYDLPDYNERQKRYEYLTENDKNEEIFVEVFSDYITQSYSNNDIINWIESDKTLFYEHQRFIDDLINPDKTTTNESIKIIGTMSFDEVIGIFGTGIKKGTISQVLNSDFSKLSRQMTNLKTRLLEDNKLTENCY